MDLPTAFRLTTLGALELRGPHDHVVQPVLAQPKRAAVLIYLALARPRGLHQRDSPLALFWPERDQQSARKALRQALYFLRAALGEGVIVTIGESELGISERVWCDVVAMERALEQGRTEEALALYRGDFLPGFHLDGAPELAEWLEAERGRLRALAAQAALRLARDQSASGATTTAVHWARRAAELAQSDETIVREVIKLLRNAGETTAAVRIYDDFANLLSRSYDLEPSAETRALADAMRSGATMDRVGAGSARALPPEVAPAGETPPPSAAAPPATGAPGKPAVWRRTGRVTVAAAGVLIVGAWMSGLIPAHPVARPSASVAVGQVHCDRFAAPKRLGDDAEAVR